MGLAIKGKITGLESLRPALAALSRKIEKRLAGKAVAAGGRELLKGVKSALVAYDTGSLRRSLGSKVIAYRGGAVTLAIVGPRTGVVTTGRGAKRRRRLSKLGQRLQAAGKGPALYAHLVEGGARPHALGKGSSLRKKVGSGRLHPGARPQPFMRPGYERAKAAAQAKVAAVLTAGIAAAGG